MGRDLRIHVDLEDFKYRLQLYTPRNLALPHLVDEHPLANPIRFGDVLELLLAHHHHLRPQEHLAHPPYYPRLPLIAMTVEQHCW